MFHYVSLFIKSRCRFKDYYFIPELEKLSIFDYCLKEKSTATGCYNDYSCRFRQRSSLQTGADTLHKEGKTNGIYILKLDSKYNDNISVVRIRPGYLK